jgi:hypothetical protein
MTDRIDLDPYIEDSTEPTEELIENASDAYDGAPTRYSITSYGADYPVDGLVRRMDEGDVFVPAFQRAYVWDPKRASRFIESLLLGLPVPGIFLSRELDTDKMLVIDGQQRLKTLQAFYRGVFPETEEPFALVGLNNRLDGTTYATLNAADKRRLNDAILHATVVRQDQPTDGNSSVYQVFARLNTGGMQLTAQEIRASVFHGPFSDALHELNLVESWRRIFGPVNKRLRDEELILRFFAFYFRPENYGRSLNGFLNEYMEANRFLQLQDQEVLAGVFVPVISAASEALGHEAFRGRRTLNAAVFDAVMVGMARRHSSGRTLRPEHVARVYSSLLSDPNFVAATETGTNAQESVRSRLQLATEAFAVGDMPE